MDDRFLSEHTRIGTWLQCLMAVSMVLILIGLGLFIGRGGDVTVFQLSGVPGPGAILRQALDAEPLALISLGILVLIVTPFVRVVGAVVTFIFDEKDPTYAAISLGVLTVLAAGIFIPGLG